MKTVQQWFDEYGESHQNSVNKRFHFICVPSIFFSIIGLLSSIPHSFTGQYFSPHVNFFINFGLLLILLALIFYIRLSFSLFVGIAAISFLSLEGNYLLSTLKVAPLWVISLIIFILAWIGQFYGHKVEGKKPSFFKDVQFLLIGPAWILGFIYKKFGIKY